MGYFDDPKHKAQWEKELSELRQEKARVKAGLPPVSDMAERSASRNMEKTVPENDLVSGEMFDRSPREAAASNDIPEKQAEDGAEKAAVSEEVRAEKTEPAAVPKKVKPEKAKAAAVPEKVEPEKADREERTAPRRPAAERAHSGEPHRVKITFEELLRRENMYTPPKLTKRPRSPELQKEVSHEL